MADKTVQDFCRTIADACEAQRTAWKAYTNKREQIIGNSMLSPSGRQQMQDALDAEWAKQRAALVEDVKTAVDGIYAVEREAEVGFLVDPGLTEAVALLDRLGDTLPARSIQEIGTRFLGSQPALRTLYRYAVERCGIPQERVASAFDGMMYDADIINEMADAVEGARTSGAVPQMVGAMDGGIIEQGAATIAASFERPRWVGGRDGMRPRAAVMF